MRGLLRNIGTLEESMAKFYLVEMIACVEALHRLGFVHRDLSKALWLFVRALRLFQLLAFAQSPTTF